jgi:ABC-type phosphate transport system permease subunit
MLPVVAFVAMTAVIVTRAMPAIQEVGLRELASTDFSSAFLSRITSYGMVPGFVGTVLVVCIAMSLALPTALAIGIFTSEFPLGPLSRVLRLVLGVLAGIPPIVYALMAFVLARAFIAPKFSAGFQYSTADPTTIGVSREDWPPSDVPWNAGAFPWDLTGFNNSTLLGGIMLALLALPFIAPLVEDALRNVPHDPKEASLALGANRWYTLRRVTLPRAMPGIVGAASLGALKVLGDVMIVVFVVGWESGVPNPVWDVLERTGPLTSVGAGLVGGFNGPGSCPTSAIVPGPNGPMTVPVYDCDVGYFSALLLLAMAVVIVVATSFLQARLRRRLRA